MRSLSEIELDNKKIETLARDIVDSISQYVDYCEEIHKKRLGVIRTFAEGEDIKKMKLAVARLINKCEEYGEQAAIKYLLAYPENFDEAVPLDGDRCPNCREMFPGDLFLFQQSMYCPYCGKKVVKTEDDLENALLS